MNIIVNGGSEGIGREIVLQLSDDRNNQVLVTGRNESRLKELQMECLNENVSYLRMDISEVTNLIEAVRDQIYNRFSRVDILINVAGLLIVGEFMKLSDKDSRKMMETNFFGPAAFIRLVVPMMSSGSHIVNISSM